MKKYSLVFVGCIYSGGFTNLDNAANACFPGSGKMFTETNNEELGDHVVFTDANGDVATIVPGDAIQPVFDGETFNGYLAVDASIVKTWQEVPAPATNDAAGNVVG